MPRGPVQRAAIGQADLLRTLVHRHYRQHARATTRTYRDQAFGEVWEAKLEPWPAVTVAAENTMLAGTWTLSSYWRYTFDPADRRTVVLVDSSVGINVAELPACHPLHSPDGSSMCLARYDYDLHDDVPHHLNIRQAGSLQDRVHWRLPFADTDVPPWDAEQILAWMASGSFASDLQRRCGWPAA